MQPRSAQLKVRWKAHRSARSLLHAFLREPARDLKCTPEQLLLGGAKAPERFEDFLRIIERHGKWAFAETLAKPPIVHYWHGPGTSVEDLAYMFGHELGHLSGKPLRNDSAEEDRADEYGEVVLAVMRRLKIPLGRLERRRK